MPQTYQVDVTLSEGNDDSVVGVTWLAVGGRNIQAARVKPEAGAPSR